VDLRGGREAVAESASADYFDNVTTQFIVNILQVSMVYLTTKEAQAVYHTVIKQDRHLTRLRTRGECRKHEPQASVLHFYMFYQSFFYISLVFSNARRVLS